ncbi:MAG: hypothetical protein ACPHJ3_13400, partial [Rubripirellula sp.]
NSVCLIATESFFWRKTLSSILGVEVQFLAIGLANAGVFGNRRFDRKHFLYATTHSYRRGDN